MKQMFKIKPAQASLKVLDPDTKEPLKKSGEVKEKNEYWIRRVLDGSVVVVTETEKKE